MRRRHASPEIRNIQVPFLTVRPHHKVGEAFPKRMPQHLAAITDANVSNHNVIEQNLMARWIRC